VLIKILAIIVIWVLLIIVFCVCWWMFVSKFNELPGYENSIFNEDLNGELKNDNSKESGI